MDSFFDLSGCELVALAAIIAIYISQNFTLEEINILGSFFTVLGDNLSAIGAASSNCDSN